MEVEGQLRAVEMRDGVFLWFTVIADQRLERQIDFPDQHPVAVFIQNCPHVAHNGLRLGLISVEDRLAALRIVAEQIVLDQQPQDIHAEAVDAAIEPEAHCRVHRLADVGIAPVQVRLLGQERVVVELAGCGVESPRRSAEVRHPIVRRAAIWSRVAPQIPVALRVCARASRLHKPRMLVGCVVRHEIENQLQSALVDRLSQGIEVGQGTEERIDIAVVGDVVAEVRHRRRVERRDPDGVDTQRDQIVEPGEDSA